MVVGIAGSSGYISGFLLERLQVIPRMDRILKFDMTEDADIHLDLRTPEQFDPQIFDQVDVLVFTAAISGPDKCASEYQACWQINGRRI